MWDCVRDPPRIDSGNKSTQHHADRADNDISHRIGMYRVSMEIAYVHLQSVSHDPYNNHPYVLAMMLAAASRLVEGAPRRDCGAGQPVSNRVLWCIVP